MLTVAGGAFYLSPDISGAAASKNAQATLIMQLQGVSINDLPVEALRYRIRHADDVDCAKAKPLQHEEPQFEIRIENACATITMKSNHATVQAARDAVEPFLRAWELDVPEPAASLKAH